MAARRGNGKGQASERSARHVGRPILTEGEGRRALHELNNTLASLRLRVGILAVDQTCLVAQGENVMAVLSITDEAIESTRRLQSMLDAVAGAPRPSKSAASRRARANGRG